MSPSWRCSPGKQPASPEDLEVAEHPPENEEHDDGAEASAAHLLGAPASRQPAQQLAHLVVPPIRLIGCSPYVPDMADTRTLLRAGAIAGPLYLIVGYAQAFTRAGFDLSRHALSQLANGDRGWIQTLNFALSGVLAIVGAMGVRRALRG